MKGVIRPAGNQKCHVCGQRFELIDQNSGFACPKHLTRPYRYLFDFWHEGKRWRLYSDKSGHALQTYTQALCLAEDVRHDMSGYLRIRTLNKVRRTSIKGVIRPAGNQKCHVCGQRFELIDQNSGFACPKHLTRPYRYLFDFWHEGKRWRLYSDKSGHALQTYTQALCLAEDVRHDMSGYLRIRTLNKVRRTSIKGVIRPAGNQKCHVCGQRFELIDQNSGFACPKHLTRPYRYLFDFWHEGKRWRLYSDKSGHALQTYTQALCLAEDVRHDMSVK